MVDRRLPPLAPVPGFLSKGRPHLAGDSPLLALPVRRPITSCTRPLPSMSPHCGVPQAWCDLHRAERTSPSFESWMLKIPFRSQH